MKILGWTAGGHDSSYAILEDGEIIIHEELERLTRIKETNEDVIKYYVENIGSLDEFNHFTTFIHGNHLFYSRLFSEMLYGKENVDLAPSLEQSLNKELLNKYSEIGHHVAHAANAFYASPFNRALIFSIDGGGWDNLERSFTNYGLSNGRHPGTFTIWLGEGNKIYPIVYMIRPNIGAIWAAFTRGLGYSESGPPFGNQAGTIMGMAAHGDPDSLGDRDLFNIEIGELNEQQRFDFAAKLQKWTEDIVKELMASYMKSFDIKDVCLTGGVALNCVMAGKIQDWFSLNNVFVPPVPYDAGLAIGTAQYYYHHILNNPRSNHISYRSPYLGKQYSKEQILEALDKRKDLVSYKESNDEHVCRLLDEQNVISIFGGRSESGRRALGNRSIVADPRRATMKELINDKTKHRSWFRPLAPSILKEYTAEWFVKDIDSPYMSFSVPFKEEKRELVPAVVHKDGTGRLQTVTEELNPRFHKLLTEWYKVSGVPILINTSFNDKEPIVETPDDALNCFLKTKIDYLYFTDFNLLVEKI